MVRDFETSPGPTAAQPPEDLHDEFRALLDRGYVVEHTRAGTYVIWHPEPGYPVAVARLKPPYPPQGARLYSSRAGLRWAA